MRPPYYNALSAALSHKDRNGLAAPDSESEAATIRKICLETSEYRQSNREKWAFFVTTNPSDPCSKYMQPFL